ncbi:hypothetical protein [Ammoniphilus resinae]|uniref:Uncharacterized protein n=1 Tax=Ammoniphilus resinae TaxID=861532 RepID=A0ABS4GWE3_9BACL|nr:hypothetical protein [Ammoniphilus resinae]MBP1934581.1 hypothetical protein [Ammoniphilus resinae]
MTLIDVKEVFNTCEYPFYKEVMLNSGTMTCTIYSTHSDFKKQINIPLLNFDQAVHYISLNIIQLRSYEMIHKELSEDLD